MKVSLRHSEFFMWQEEERRKEDAAKLARVERLRQEMHASPSSTGRHCGKAEKK